MFEGIRSEQELETFPPLTHSLFPWLFEKRKRASLFPQAMRKKMLPYQNETSRWKITIIFVKQPVLGSALFWIDDADYDDLDDGNVVVVGNTPALLFTFWLGKQQQFKAAFHSSFEDFFWFLLFFSPQSKSQSVNVWLAGWLAGWSIDWAVLKNDGSEKKFVSCPYSFRSRLRHLRRCYCCNFSIYS